MKNDRELGEQVEMRPEYDLSQMKVVGRGIYFERYWRAKDGRFLNPELADRFQDDDSVNKALLEYLQLKRQSAC